VTKLGLIIPCFNEALRLQSSLFIKAIGKYQELVLIFVDDGSTDKTKEVITDIIQLSPPNRVQLVSLAQNAGKAEAIRQGILQTCPDKSFTHLGYWDADLATPFSELKGMMSMLTSNEHLGVLGARIKLAGWDITRNKYRHYLGRICCTLVDAFFHLNIYDTQCGAKIFCAPAFINAIQQPFHSRWIFDIELLLRMRASHHLPEPFIEYPLAHWKDISASHVRGKDYVKALLDLLILIGKYRDCSKPKVLD
jgi:glycosyltransferase involved in cell wall biosynthesis